MKPGFPYKGVWAGRKPHDGNNFEMNKQKTTKRQQQAMKSNKNQQKSTNINKNL